MQRKIDIETRNIIRDSKQYHIIKTLKHESYNIRLEDS
jgi:hypothetical protein